MRLRDVTCAALAAASLVGCAPGLPARTAPDCSLRLSPWNGVIWFQHDPAVQRESVKLYADGEEGWVAQVDRRLVFIKLFTDVAPEQQAPSEGEVVLYVHGNGAFVEVEQQGAYVELVPGATTTNRVDWLVRELPTRVVGSPGEPALLEFVRQILRTSRA